MSSLLKKDFYTTGQTLKKQLFLALVLGIGIAFYIKSGIYVTGMFVMMMSMSVLSAFSIDEYSKFNAFALTLPITRKDLVLSKYFLILIADGIGALVGFFGGMLVDCVYGTFNFIELLLAIFLCVCVFLIISAISLPLYFKFGTEKGRTLNTLIFVLPVILVAIIGGQFSSYSEQQLQTVFTIAIFAVVALAVGGLILSYKISLSICKKKEY